MVEHLLAKEDVASSSLVTRSPPAASHASGDRAMIAGKSDLLILRAMKKKTFLGGLLALVITSAIAEPVPDYTAVEAAKHIGETATVTDRVDGAHQAKGGSIFLNMGGTHPNEAFTVFIPGSQAAKFPKFKEYEGAQVSVSGKIVTHGDKPQIIVNSPDQITIKEAAPEKAESPAPSSTSTP